MRSWFMLAKGRPNCRSDEVCVLTSAGARARAVLGRHEIPEAGLCPVVGLVVRDTWGREGADVREKPTCSWE